MEERYGVFGFSTTQGSDLKYFGAVKDLREAHGIGERLVKDPPGDIQGFAVLPVRVIVSVPDTDVQYWQKKENEECRAHADLVSAAGEVVEAAKKLNRAKKQSTAAMNYVE